MAAFFFKIYIDEDDDTGERSVRAAITAGGAGGARTHDRRIMSPLL